MSIVVVTAVALLITAVTVLALAWGAAQALVRAWRWARYMRDCHTAWRVLEQRDEAAAERVYDWSRE